MYRDMARVANQYGSAKEFAEITDKMNDLEAKIIGLILELK